MTLIEQITNLNNNAVTMMQGGNFSEAVINFIDALPIFQDGCSQVEHNGLNQNYDGPVFQWADQDCEQPAEKCFSYIYSRPLILLPFTNSGKARTQVTAAILFNVALSLHLQGTTPSVSKLKKTLGFYLRAKKLMSGFPVLQAAVLFNVGLIQQELLDFNKAKTCFELVGEFLFKEELFNKNGSIKLHIDDRKAMVLNVATFQEPRVAAAA